MPKIVVTEGLAQTIKMLRSENKIKSKALAEAIGKTPGYITKLEKKELKTIDVELVNNIFFVLLGKEYEKTETWEKIFASLQIKYSKEEIEYEVWFANFDTVHRLLPIPDVLIDYLNEQISTLNITREYLLQRINANEDLSDEELNNNKLKTNVWYHSEINKCSSIKIDLTPEKLFNILDKNIKSECYVFVFCILYYLLKIEMYGDAVKLEKHQMRELKNRTTSILNNYKFYSIIERETLISEASTKEEIHSILNSFDNKNIELISELLNRFKVASEINICATNERLSGFIENLSNDIWFTLKLISLDYHLLESIEFEQKKEFIKEVESLINKFKNVQKVKKETEIY